ncbi:helix-turn-helix protein, partial [Dictyocaulus viviparus]
MDFLLESDPEDFVPNELCLLCDRQGEQHIIDMIDKSTYDSSSGVCSSTSPCTSPQTTQALLPSSTDATIFNMTNFYERTRETMMRMQAAQQLDEFIVKLKLKLSDERAKNISGKKSVSYEIVYSLAVYLIEMISQMHMLGFFGLTPNISPEIHRLIIENQLSVVNPFLGNSLWNVQTPPPPPYPLMHFQPPTKSCNDLSTDSRSREEQPLDLSRKSGLEAIIDIENANYNHKQRKQSQHHQQSLAPIEKEITGHDVMMKNGYNIKRNYSQIDLTAAVNDIRCGRLGTRRASVVYGIPRSTLRNKIYKLEAAEEQAGQTPINKRRRPGGQSSAEKKLAEQVERQKKTSTPITDCSSVSPSSDGTEEEKADSAETHWDSDWTTNLWQSLFNQNTTTIASDIMKEASKKENKKEELSEWKKSRPKRGQY